ncbi:TPA: hypothetical protein N0F65_010020 [Lagenidium giganteum]|uniref:Uncharacterized protein n=1 Tax=Lagenidium giganteum TaxID=4803 RepID=A0AAV2ZHU9_9STRA|nr:TPA: hypothetical protein N0F65_010020 [Lagenidium giganteum]
MLYGEPLDMLAMGKAPAPLSMDQEWDSGYGSHRKQSVGSQPPSFGVIRNDRTPLNTPYTPQLIKLQLTHHAEAERSDLAFEPAKQFFKGKIALVIHPVRKLRKAIELALTRILPKAMTQSTFYAKYRDLLLWYCTTVLCIPFALLLSPMVIAFCICTSPIWVAGLVVLFIRNLAMLWSNPHAPLHESYATVPSPSGHILHHPHGTRPHHHQLHQPSLSSAYRRSSQMNGHPYG